MLGASRHRGNAGYVPPARTNYLLDNLVSAWEMNETSGNMIDSHNGYNGTTVVGVTRTSGDYYSFVPNNYVLVPDRPEFTFTDEEFSISFMVNTTSTTSTWMFYKGSNSTNREYSVTTYPDGRIFFRIFNSATGSSNDLFSTSAVNDGNWHVVVINCTGSVAKVFVDNIFEAQVTITVSCLDRNSPLNFGRYGAGSLYWTGKCKRFRIWSAALSDGSPSIGSSATGKTAFLYNGGAGRSYGEFD